MQYSVVNLNKAINTPGFRLDAEFYSPYYLESEQLVLAKNNNRLGDIISVLTDYHANGSYEVLRGNVEILDSPDYALMIRTVDLERDDFEHDVKYVSEHAYNFLKKTKVFGGEIIINKIGNAGKVYIVPPLDKKVSLGMNQFMIRPKEDLDNYFLYIFLVCKYGRLLLEQRVTGAVPLSIDKNSVRSVPVPIFTKSFQEIIHKLVEQYFFLNNQGKDIYFQAEQLLLSELGLWDWKPKHRLTFVKNFSDTQKAERFDAEYFQPKYEEIIKAVKKYEGGFVKLAEVATTKRGSLIPDKFYTNEKETPYIRGADFSSGFLSDDKLVYIDNSFKPSRGTITRKNDIVFALIGTVGTTALIDEKFDKAFISNNIGKISVKNYNPFTLQVLLHSTIGKLYFEKEQTQTAQPKISDKDIHNFILPLLKDNIISEIEIGYIESQKNKKFSKSLLEIAKRGVEMAIEKDEKEAEKWINTMKYSISF